MKVSTYATALLVTNSNGITMKFGYLSALSLHVVFA